MYFTNPNKRTWNYITQKFRRCNLWSHSIMACKLKLRFTLTQKQNRDNFLCMFRSLRRFKYFNVKAASFYRPSNSIRPSSSSYSCLLHNFTVLNSSLEGPVYQSCRGLLLIIFWYQIKYIKTSVFLRKVWLCYNVLVLKEKRSN